MEWVVNAMPRLFQPWEKALVPILGDAGWAPGPVSMGMGKRKSFPQYSLNTRLYIL